MKTIEEKTAAPKSSSIQVIVLKNMKPMLELETAQMFIQNWVLIIETTTV